MSRNLFLVLFAVAATMLHGSAAQTRHVVGDATGWTVPPGGAATFATWASNQTFTVGDTLVFNFTTGHHDVARVTKSGYDACNGGSTIFRLTSGPSATVALNETGEQYYICSFGSHCSLGQKLAINVTIRASSTTPSGSGSPPPRTNPIPTPTPAPALTPQASSNTPPPNSAPINVTVTGTSPSPSPSSSSSYYYPSSFATPPTHNSAAASLGVVGIFATLLSVVAHFFY